MPPVLTTLHARGFIAPPARRGPLRFGDVPDEPGKKETAPEKTASRKALWISVVLNVASSLSLIASSGIGYFIPEPAVADSQKPTPNQPFTDADVDVFAQYLEALPGKKPVDRAQLKQQLNSLRNMTLTLEQHSRLGQLLMDVTRSDLTPETLAASADRIKSGMRDILTPQQFEAIERQLEDLGTAVFAAPPEQRGNPNDKNLQWWMDFLHRLGWVIISTNILFETYNGMVFSYKSKQPAMVASKVLAVGLSGLQAVHPTMPVRAALGFDAVLATWGWANMLRNDYLERTGQPRGREFDMKPLFEVDREALKMQLGHDPSRMELTREWVKKLGTRQWWNIAGEAGKFMMMDPVNAFRDAGQSIRAHYTQPGGFGTILKNDLRAIKNTVAETKRYFRRERTELPPALASHHQARLGAMIGAITNVPMIMWGNDPEFVKKMLMISALLGTPGKLTLFLQTLEDRDAKDFLTRLKNWWIRAAILPSYYLDMHSQHDWSVGAGRLAMGVPFQLYQIADIYKKDKKELEEAKQKNHPS